MLPRHRLADAARRLEPHQQGQLDGLCGLYSIVNAVRLLAQPIRPLNRAQVRRLFLAGVEYLDGHFKLAQVINSGMSTRTWLALLPVVVTKARSISTLDIETSILLADRPNADLPRTLRRIRLSLARGRPVIVTLLGAYDHTTVAVGFTDHRLVLFDSYGFRHVALSTLGVHHSRSTARHQIVRGSLTALRVPP